MNHSLFGKYLNVELRPICSCDLEPLRKWRNDKNATSFLTPIDPITIESQKKWFRDYIVDENIYTFAIVEKEHLNRIVGSVSLYNFRGLVAEIGKIQIGDTEAHGMGIGKKALVICAKIGFEHLGLSLIDGAVHQQNIAAHKNDIAVGFAVVGQKPSVAGGLEDIIEITYDRLKEVNPYVKDIQTSNTGFAD